MLTPGWLAAYWILILRFSESIREIHKSITSITFFDLWISLIDSENVNIKIQYAANNPGVLNNFWWWLLGIRVSPSLYKYWILSSHYKSSKWCSGKRVISFDNSQACSQLTWVTSWENCTCVLFQVRRVSTQSSPCKDTNNELELLVSMKLEKGYRALDHRVWYTNIPDFKKAIYLKNQPIYQYTNFKITIYNKFSLPGTVYPHGGLN